MDKRPLITKDMVLALLRQGSCFEPTVRQLAVTLRTALSGNGAPTPERDVEMVWRCLNELREEGLAEVCGAGVPLKASGGRPPALWRAVVTEVPRG